MGFHALFLMLIDHGWIKDAVIKVGVHHHDPEVFGVIEVYVLIGKGNSGLKRIGILTEHLAALVPNEVPRYGVYPCIEIKLAIFYCVDFFSAL